MAADTRAHRRRPQLARSDRGRARATEPNRVAGHPRHAVALAPAPHRRALDPTTSTAGPTVDLSRDSPTRTAPRSRESNLGIPPHPRRTHRARPPPRCVHGLGRSSTTPESTPHPHARKSPGRSSCGPRPPSPATSPPSTPSRYAGSTCCSSSRSAAEVCTSAGSPNTPRAHGSPKRRGTCSSTTPMGSLGRVRSCATAAANSLEHSTRSSEPKAARSSKHQCAPPWRTRSPNAGSAPFDASSSTAPSSGTVASSTILSSTTSIITTRTGPTVRSTSDHPSPPTLQTSQTDTSKSLERPAVTDSSTSTEMPPDQPRHSFRHPHGCTPRPSRNRIRLRHSKGFLFWSGAGMHTPSRLKWHWPSAPDPRPAASRMHTAYS